MKGSGGQNGNQKGSSGKVEEDEKKTVGYRVRT